MSSVQILDVTLRDGGYRNNFQFDVKTAVEIVGRLAASGVKLIEIGYYNGSFVRKREHGLTANVDKDYIDAVKEAASDAASICVMVHPHNVTNEDLSFIASSGVHAIRVCLRDDNLRAGLTTIRAAKSLGLLVSANVIRISEVRASRIIRMAVASSEAGADIVCLADSNGAMLPHGVGRLVQQIASACDASVGFHAHNHLSLALANSIAAQENGAEYIDCAICGMGKGAGNLNVAMLVAYWERTGQTHTYELEGLLRSSHQVASMVPTCNQPHPLLDIQMGAYNLSIDKGPKDGSGEAGDDVFRQLQDRFKSQKTPGILRPSVV
ncbi:hypothetical protein JUN65_04215 [Gluconacetobacter azotocaptans]|uniref:hypothetical protein n=1 Tax=Gluconacetobacter azotocaptans TaxID=142834 RepID=UPI00195E679C|nr:hypothetical protein [Gluconacetobacter azotocaptans]MBM9400790.1 hypothetical protein [Gluconacetobacter azotocaptans]